MSFRGARQYEAYARKGVVGSVLVATPGSVHDTRLRLRLGGGLGLG